MKRIYQLSLALLWGSLCSIVTHAQQAYQPSKIIPPSPTAASLGTYGEYPVNYYSGTTSVDIPLFDICTGSQNLPINLKYFSTGVRVGDNAGWVGLGWSLSAGGLITRTIRGMNDMKLNNTYSGYYYSPPIPSKFDIGGMTRDMLNPNYYNFFDSVNYGNYDQEPDIYTYNFGAYTGKFILGKSAAGAPVFMDQRNNLKVEYNDATDRWKITDPGGYKFYFGTQEKVTDYNYTGGYELRDDASLGSFNTPTDTYITSSWYLDSIVAPTAEVIGFTYAQTSQSLSMINKSEAQYNMLSMTGGLTSASDCGYTTQPGGAATYSYYTASRQLIYDIYLKRISFSQGYIDFNTTDRDDIEYQGVNKPAKLSEIVIRDINNNPVKYWEFYYSDFLSAISSSLSNDYTNARRLKLDSLIEKGADGSSKPPYKFNYSSPNDIPYKYTKGIDGWGYFNGVTTNTSLVPSEIIPSTKTYLDGADKRPFTAVTDLQKGVLASVVYPTGGMTRFDYEPNDYNNLNWQNQFVLSPQTAYASAILDNTQNLTASFDINVLDTPVVTFQTRYKKTSSDPNLFYIGDYAHVYKDGNLYYNFMETNNTQPVNYADPQTEVWVLYPGHYTIDVRYIQGFNFSITASWSKRVPVIKQYGGGLRIARITNTDYDNTIQVRRFKYTTTNDTTSGKMISPQIYDFNLNTGESKTAVFTSGCTATYQWAYQYLGRMSSSIPRLGFTPASGIIGYGKVTELSGENGENGRTEYYFINNPDFPSGRDYPFLRRSPDPMNGRMTQSLVYDANGRLVKSSTYSNQNLQITYTPGVKIFAAPWISPYPQTDGPPSYAIAYYNNESDWIVQSSVLDAVYDPSGKNAVVSTTRTYYDNFTHLNPTRQETTKSNGNTIGVWTSYPQDFLTGTAFVDSMVAAHILSKPIETTRYQIDAAGNTTILSGQIMTYKPDHTGLLDKVKFLETVQPVGLASFKFSNVVTGVMPYIKNQTLFQPDSRFVDRYAVYSYGNYGNILEQGKINDNREVYFWGYNDAYPIAKLVGTDYNTAKQYVNLSLLNSSTTTDAQMRAELNKLRTNLPQAMVTTYTYTPLKGVTSQTDENGKTVYYEYDAFGRLMDLRDKDGNIIKTLEYHFRK